MTAEHPAGVRETSAGRPVLGITLDSMWSVKDYILTGALKRFAEDGPLVVWVPPAFLDGARHLLVATGNPSVPVRPFRPFSPGFLFSVACKVQKSLRFERYDVATEQVLKRRRAGTVVRARGPLANSAAAAVRLIAKSPLATQAERLIARARRRLVPRALYKEEFDEAGIRVLLTTDPINRQEDPMYVEARRRRLPLATLVLSWDHLTSKGIIHGSFDTVMVWNEVMREQLALLYPWYRPEQIAVVGYPRFDIYGNAFPSRFARVPFLRSLGLDPARPVLLFASSASKAFRSQWEVVEHLCQSLDCGLFGAAQLLIRCHPHDDIAEVDRFRGRPNVAVWPARERGQAGTLFEQMPDPDELFILAASVTHSAGVITAGSSLMLDAARCNVPIICVAYDGDQTLPSHDSVSSVYGYSHQQPLHQLGATDICYSRDELTASIRRALADPARQEVNRKAIVNRFLGGYGSSVTRIRGVLRTLLMATAVPM